MAAGQAQGELTPAFPDDGPPALRRVAIVGAGLAGLACALALAALPGVQVQVVDAAAQAPSGPGHVNVIPSLLRDLVALGVGPAVAQAGFAYHGLDVHDARGRVGLQLPTQPLAGSGFPAALGLRRTDLLQILADEAVARGAQLQRRVLIQAEGGKLQLPQPADLLLLATGVLPGPAAELRQTLFPQALSAQPLGQRWWYAEVARPRALDRAALHVGAVGRKVFVLPVTAHRAGLTLIEPDEQPVPPDQRAAHLRRLLADTALAPLAAQLPDGTPVTLRPVHSALLAGPWSNGPVLAVGEAAHALPPHFGHGVAQALEDARVLAELLPGAADVGDLATRFQQRRQPRVQRVHALALQAAQWDLAPCSDTDLDALHRQLADAVSTPA
jgi:2-polyprenyl-6-methoxyphenol hydroxylase-like FAD-dependent oxidoreductase